jgi:hypothetical protein
MLIYILILFLIKNKVGYRIMDSELVYFKKTGFFREKDAALKHLQDADEILTSVGVDYCLLFGTLLGLLRHGDFIPWDDDLDIIIFDIEKFEKRCIGKFEKRGYNVLQDIRKISPFRMVPFPKITTRCGYRIYSKDGKIYLAFPGNFHGLESGSLFSKKDP